MSGNYPKVVNQTVNLGSLPYVSNVDEEGQRTIAFHEDHIIERFPRGLSLVRIQNALEINLFLEHRYKGLFMPPKRGGKKNPLGGVSLITVQSLANSMSLFLQWVERNNVDWHEVYAVSDSDKAKYWLPVYRYRKHLIEQVIAKDIDRDTANLYINHVRQFYEWARMQRRIDKVPFKYKTKVIKKKLKDGGLDLLFTDYGSEEKGFNNINKMFSIRVTEHDITELERMGCNYQSVSSNHKKFKKPYKVGDFFNFTAHQFRHTFAWFIVANHLGDLDDIKYQYKHLEDIQPSNQHSIILANPPFGGKERKEVQENFPIQTGETTFSFLQHFIKMCYQLMW